MVGSVDELPPPYTSVTGGAPMVTCRVCQVCLLIFILLELLSFFPKFNKVINIQFIPIPISGND